MTTARICRSIAAALLMPALLASGTARATPTDGLAPLPGDTRPINYKVVVTLDPERSRYTASSTLRFEVLKPTRRIVVHSRGLHIDSAQLIGGERASVGYDEARQQVAFTLTQPLAKGEHQLQVTYGAPIGTTAEGLFQVTYPEAGTGAQKKMYFTMMCCTATGRMFMPLWDRPNLKAAFELELVVPRELDAVANMPVVKREPAADGMDRVVFAPTPKMSSYLLFFGVGQFDRIEQRVGATGVSVITQRGKAEHGRLALDASVATLGYYNEYFQAPYPLPKLDNVAYPGAGAFGAMENWGAIFYFEPYLLLDPRLTTDEDRQRVYQVVAHEVSHQWFGNLVTMHDWDDLWLNEGFASWMATKTTDHFHPKWNIWLRDSEQREGAMQLDARASTHPIIRKVKTLEEAELAFDEITYQKGSQVIRMIEAHVGEDAFRTAIRAHIRNHAYGNTVTADLWRELERASPVPVAAIARDFTEQDGVPLVDVVSSECDAAANRTRVMLKQGRFGLDEISRRPRDWNVPVTAAVAGSSNVARSIVCGARATRLTLEGCGPVKINVGESAYFRTRYDAATFSAIEQGFGRFPAADQLGLLNDTYSLGEAGYVHFGDYWRLASLVSPAADPLLQLHLVRSADSLDRLYSGLAGQQAFRTFARGQLSGLLAAAGWTPRPNEPANMSTLRGALIETLAALGDEATLAEAQRRFRASATDSSAVSTETRRAIVTAVGIGADARLFDELARLAAISTNTAEKRMYYLALARASSPAVARQALELALGDQIPAALTPLAIRAVAETHPQLAFDFVTSHFEAVLPRLDSTGRVSFVPSIAAHGFDAALAQRLADFARDRIGTAGQENVSRAQSKILFNAEVRASRLQQIDQWLRTSGRLL